MATAQSSDPNWGCKVLLCLSNPHGPTAASGCQPPISALWSALAHGDPFPSCNMQDSSGNNLGPSPGNYASNTWASPSNCLPPYIIYVGESSTPVCTLAGEINVTVAGQPFTQIWWNTEGFTLTTFNAVDPNAGDTYQAQLAAYNQQQQQVAQQDQGGGGN